MRRTGVPSDYPVNLPAEPSPILVWFDYDHLPEHLQGVSRAFSELAHEVEERLPAGAEKSTALRKLLEAKDAAVRAAIEGWTEELVR